jgi:hypothetical protein
MPKTPIYLDHAATREVQRPETESIDSEREK